MARRTKKQRSVAARKGWRTRRANLVAARAAAARRSEASRRGWVTRRNRAGKVRAVKTGARTVHRIRVRVPGTWDEATHDAAGILFDAFERLARQLGPVDTKRALWSSGYEGKTSSDDDDDGEPVWDDWSTKSLTSFYGPPSNPDGYHRARFEATDRLRGIADGNMEEPELRHFYRLWVKYVFVIAAIGPKTKKQKQREAKRISGEELIYGV